MPRYVLYQVGLYHDDDKTLIDVFNSRQKALQGARQHWLKEAIASSDSADEIQLHKSF